MKQLLHHFQDDNDESELSSSSSSYFVVGLQDRVLVGAIDNISSTTSSSLNKKKKQQQPQQQAVGRLLFELVLEKEDQPQKKKEAAGPDASTTADNNNNKNGANDDDETTRKSATTTTKTSPTTSCNNNKHMDDEQKMALSPVRQIQAVAGTIVVVEEDDSDDDSSTSLSTPPQHASKKKKVMYLAVATHDKRLAIYRADDYYYDSSSSNDHPESSLSPRRLYPVTLHQTTKRVCSLCFARVPPPSSSLQPGTNDNHGRVGGSSSGALNVIITGDAAGDAFAYSLRLSSLSSPNTNNNNDHDDDDDDDKEKRAAAAETTTTASVPTVTKHSRLLLGHTGSMLTSVVVMAQSNRGDDDGDDDDYCYILTADRDEKIRVSYFPATTVIHGYLLGHEAFVSSLAVPAANTDSNGNAAPEICVSCGGDGMLRVWNYQTCHELASCRVAAAMPTEMPRQDKTTSAAAATNDTDAGDNQKDSSEAPTLVPSKVVIGPVVVSVNDRFAYHASVIFDDSNLLSTFCILAGKDANNNNKHNNGSKQAAAAAATNEDDVPRTRPSSSFCQIDSIVQEELPAQPLAVAMINPSQLLVLMRDPEYLKIYSLVSSLSSELEQGVQYKFASQPVQAVVDWALKAGPLVLPQTILEKDKVGQYKMQKHMETRGPKNDMSSMPWNDARRIELAKGRNKRSRLSRNQRRKKKRRQQRQQKQAQSQSDTGEASNDDSDSQAEGDDDDDRPENVEEEDKAGGGKAVETDLSSLPVAS